MRHTDITLHRFKDFLAMHTDSSETEYLNLEQVIALRDQLDLFIADSKNTFIKSEFKKVDITFNNGDYD